MRTFAASQVLQRARVPFLVAPIVLGFCAVALGWVATSPIPAMTPDSVQYLNAAQNIAAGHGVVTSITPLDTRETRAPFAEWPPLYPILLSAGTAFHTKGLLPPAPLEWARLLSLLVLGLSFIPLAFLTRSMAGSRAVVPVLAFYAVFRPVQLTTSFTWSEGPFILFALLSFALLVRGLHRSGSASGPGLFLIAGAMAGLAAMTRYLGVTVAAAGAIAIVLRTEETSGAKTAERLIAFLAPAGLPIGFWLLRNHWAVGHYFGGVRGASGLVPEQVLLQTLRTIAVDWVAPPAFATAAAARIGVILGACGAIWIAACGIRRYGPETLETRGDRLTGAVLLVSFVLLYAGALIATAIRIAYDPLNTRLLAPVYPAMLLLAGALVAGAWRHPHTNRLDRAGLAGSCVLLLALNVAASVRYAEAPREQRDLTWPYWRSVAMGSTAWREHPAFQALRRLPPGTVVLSNVWEPVALFTGLPSKPLPEVGDPAFPGDLFMHEGAYVLIDTAARRDRVGCTDVEAASCPDLDIEPVGSWSSMRLYKIVNAARAGSADTADRGATGSRR